MKEKFNVRTSLARRMCVLVECSWLVHSNNADVGGGVVGLHGKDEVTETRK